jgi:sarcosine oxidase
VEREPTERDEAILREFADRYFPEGNGPTMALKQCMFTNTPDHHFIIDVHPRYPQVSFTSPCSGHGFKFASVIGEIMADLAERGDTRHNIGLFRLERFAGRGAAGTFRPRTGATRPERPEPAETIRPFW